MKEELKEGINGVAVEKNDTIADEQNDTVVDSVDKADGNRMVVELN